MISTLISRGLAFGRSGRVGADGSLTGGVFFFSFHCPPELVSGREEKFSRSRPTIPARSRRVALLHQA